LGYIALDLAATGGRKVSVEQLNRRNLIVLSGLLAPWFLVLPVPVLVAEDVTIAIKGYDPVAYFTVGKAVRGSPSITHQWDEHRYLFSSTENRKRFIADPVRYAPYFTDLCAMALSKGKVKEANPEFWLISDGKLFLFASEGAVGRFGEALAENLSQAERNHALLHKR
jgi:hypothetical protein